MHDKIKTALDQSLSHLTFSEAAQQRVLAAVRSPQPARPCRRIRPVMVMAMLTLMLAIVTGVAALPGWQEAPADHIASTHGDHGNGPLATEILPAPVTGAPRATPVHTGYITPSPAPTLPPAPDVSVLQLVHRGRQMLVYAEEAWYDGFSSRIVLYLAPAARSPLQDLAGLQLQARCEEQLLGDYHVTFQMLQHGMVRVDAYLLCPGQEQISVMGFHPQEGMATATLTAQPAYHVLPLSKTTVTEECPAPDATLYIVGDRVYLRYFLPDDFPDGSLIPISLNGKRLTPHAALMQQTDDASLLWYALDASLPGSMQIYRYVPDCGICVLESQYLSASGDAATVFIHKSH